MMARINDSLDENFSGRTVVDGRFLLLERLGSGAFGSVYRAQEHAFGEPLRTVALKLTKRRYLDEAHARELLHEGRILAALHAGCRDPNARKHLVQVYGLGFCPELESRGFLAMEYVCGVRILDHIRSFDGSIPLATARRYFLEMCTAMACCHELKPPVAHGDLKPDNILVDQTQTIRIADFGRARVMHVREGFAADMIGAFCYAAPETLMGRGTEQSDIYSLGLVMYEVLTGGGPHLGLHDYEVMTQVADFLEAKRTMRFTPIAEAYGGLDEDPVLFGLVERCLAFDCRQRPASVREILGALEGKRGSAPHPQPTPVEDWRSEMERLLAESDLAGGLRFLESLAVDHDDEYLAYHSICSCGIGPDAEALREGAWLFERTRAGRSLPPALRERLRCALIARSRELGQTDLAQYYERKLDSAWGEAAR
jgi:eukaryotic-like serine/threonine-protein kinase